LKEKSLKLNESVNKTASVPPYTNSTNNDNDGGKERKQDSIQGGETEMRVKENTQYESKGGEISNEKETERETESAESSKSNPEKENDMKVGIEAEEGEYIVEEKVAVAEDSSSITAFTKYDPNEDDDKASWFSDTVNTRLNKVLSRAFRYPIPGSSRYMPGGEKKSFDYYGGFLKLREYKALTDVHIQSYSGGVIQEDSIPVLPDEHGFQQPHLDWWGVQECDLSSGSDSDGEESS